MDIGVIIPELAKHGGAERLLIECLVRWQRDQTITIYTTQIDRKMLRAYGLGRSVRFKELTPYQEGPHSLVLNCSLLPKIWQREVGKHDVYLNHLWPTHLVDVHPMVWYPHEPLRILHDLRYNASLDDASNRKVHIYPKYFYDSLSNSVHEASLDAIATFDQTGQPDRVVANSLYTAGYLNRVYGWEVKDVVYPGITTEAFLDPSFFKPRPAVTPSEQWGKSANEIDLVPSHGGMPQNDIILSVGQLWPHKQFDRILEAIRLTDDTQLYIVGNGPEKQALQRIAEALGIADRVFFLHGLTDEQVQLLYARCLAVVFMARREPFGIVPMEALAAGKPLIANNEGGFTELVNNECAFLIPPQPSVIAEKINYLKQNPDKAYAMGRAGKAIAAQHTWDRHAQEMLTILEETASEWKKSHRKRRKTRLHRTLFGAQYYCWYGMGAGGSHWNDDLRYGGVTDMPLTGYYSSSQGDVILDHFEQAEYMGMDFLSLNLHVDENGINVYEMSVIENIMSLALQTGTKLKFCVQLCPYGITQKGFRVAMQALQEHFVDHPNYLMIKGKPVVKLFWTGVWDGDRRWLAFLKEEMAGYFLMASSLRLYADRNESKNTEGLFDAWSLFSPLELGRPEEAPKLWSQAYEAADAGTSGLRVFTVSPGYDDRHLRAPEREGNPMRCIERNDGEVFRSMQRSALELEMRPDIVMVSTFNEYHENTHIEASLNHGNQYVEMTRKFVRDVRRTWK